MVFGAFGEGQGFANQVADPLAQRAKPTFDVAGFALAPAATAVCSGGEGSLVGAPMIAARGTTPVRGWQAGPQVGRAPLAAVAQTPGYDLTRATAQGYPQPERLRFCLHETPEFIEFEHVAALAGQERVHKHREAFHFFPIQRMSVS